MPDDDYSNLIRFGYFNPLPRNGSLGTLSVQIEASQSRLDIELNSRSVYQLYESIFSFRRNHVKKMRLCEKLFRRIFHDIVASVD